MQSRENLAHDCYTPVLQLVSITICYGYNTTAFFLNINAWVHLCLWRGRRENNEFVSKDIVGMPMVKVKFQLFWKPANGRQTAQLSMCWVFEN